MGSCPQCGTQLALTLLACPRCGWLTHSDRLSNLAQAAKEATDGGDIPTALATWREALELLPRTSKQFQVISAKITELGQNIPPGLPAQPSTGRQTQSFRTTAGMGVIGAMIVGLTKSTTLISMLLSLGVYWSMWGWKFALGIVLSIYVHEMGHVIALRRLGFKASAPTFIPGIGAVIRMRQQIVNPLEDAEIGLAGPIYGLGAAVISLGLWLVTKNPVFAAIASVGAWINIFNLVPILGLDGGRGFHAMSRLQRFVATAVVAGAWLITDDDVLMLVMIVCLGRTIADSANQSGSMKTTLKYCLLVILLAAISTVRSQIPMK